MTESRKLDTREIGAIRSAHEVEQHRLVREFLMGLKRGLSLGPCSSCETFYLMAKLCLQEGFVHLSSEEKMDLESWIEAGTVVDLDTGCEGACPIIPLHSRMSR